MGYHGYKEMDEDEDELSKDSAHFKPLSLVEYRNLQTIKKIYKFKRIKIRNFLKTRLIFENAW